MVECCCTCFILSYCFIRIYLNYYKKQSFNCLSPFPPRSLASLSAPNPCAQVDGRSPCSHLCLINFNQTFSCACPHLMKLQPDKRTCKGEEVHKQAQAELKPCVNCHDIRVVVQQQTSLFLWLLRQPQPPDGFVSCHLTTVNLIACLLSPPSIPLCFYFHFSSCQNAVALNAGVLVYSSYFMSGDSWCFWGGGAVEAVEICLENWQDVRDSASLIGDSVPSLGASKEKTVN